jgi:hypothetical protein
VLVLNPGYFGGLSITHKDDNFAHTKICSKIE